MGSVAVNDQRIVPVARSSATSRPPPVPTNKRPPATAGDDLTGEPRSVAHRLDPVAVSSAYTLPSRLPTYPTPSATTGDDCTAPPVRRCQRSRPVVSEMP